jgi:very-short-patch-repair endonuclease
LADLTLKDEAKRLATPPRQGRGKGWGVSAARLEELHARAREMRNNPTEPEKWLWRGLSRNQAGAKFRRQAVIPPFIADFLCPALRLVIEVDGDTHDAATDAPRDARLSELGYRVLRFTNADVIGNIDGVFAVISDTVEALRAPHPNPSPAGEGLVAVEAQKLPGISLGGSVG